mmetsp:Transcript_50660/g.90930  ORF Transcript_50660/g.90930 Transcript_50660/m.90930 type:complete len:234 (+) Transcript_50660:404-1105(+)
MLRGAAHWRPRHLCSHRWQLCHCCRPQRRLWQDQDPSPFGRQEVGEQQVPRYGRHHCRWWPHGQAYAQGRPRIPQVQGEAQLVAQGPWCGHEPRGAPPRWRKPPAHWPRLHVQPRGICRQEVRSHRCAPYRPSAGPDRQVPQGRLSRSPLPLLPPALSCLFFCVCFSSHLGVALHAPLSVAVSCPCGFAAAGQGTVARWGVRNARERRGGTAFCRRACRICVVVVSQDFPHSW